MNFLNKFKNNKGITGADIAAAISVIVLTVGIVTVIYINAMNKSKDNLRYANAVRIATSIMERIQAVPYESFISEVGTSNSKSVNGGNSKLFDTKIPTGFEATVTANPVSGAEVDIVRTVIINVKYKSSTTYKTLTLNSVKERELIDMTNSPDLSLVPGSNTSYIYPIKKSGSNYVVTTTSDIDWYNYQDINSDGKIDYALAYKTTSSSLKVGDTVSGSGMYAWIPRFVDNSGIKFLYGTSNHPIELNTSGNVLGYKVNMGKTYTGNFSGFTANDGLSGAWYDISNPNSTAIAKNGFNKLNGTSGYAKANF